MFPKLKCETTSTVISSSSFIVVLVAIPNSFLESNPNWQNDSTISNNFIPLNFTKRYSKTHIKRRGCIKNIINGNCSLKIVTLLLVGK